MILGGHALTQQRLEIGRIRVLTRKGIEVASQRVEAGFEVSGVDDRAQVASLDEPQILVLGVKVGGQQVQGLASPVELEVGDGVTQKSRVVVRLASLNRRLGEEAQVIGLAAAARSRAAQAGVARLAGHAQSLSYGRQSRAVLFPIQAFLEHQQVGRSLPNQVQHATEAGFIPSPVQNIKGHEFQGSSHRLRLRTSISRALSGCDWRTQGRRGCLRRRVL